MPLVSIIIPCFNAEATIADTLASLQAQSSSYWEAICIDDGSTDATSDIIKEWQARDPRIQLIPNLGKGPSVARNFGAMQVAHGAIIAFCDADDLFVATKVANLIDTFDDPIVDATFGKVGFFQDSPADAKSYSTVPKHDLSIAMLLGENPVCTMSNFAIRKPVMLRVGGLDETTVHNEDLEWLIRLVGAGVIVRGQDCLQTFYRASESGLSSDLSAMIAGRKVALATAARFGHKTTSAAEAVYYRYLARRALRLGLPARVSISFALRGCLTNPRGFFNQPRRGALTLLGAIASAVLSRPMTLALFRR